MCHKQHGEGWICIDPRVGPSVCTQCRQIFRSLHLDIRLIDDTGLKHAQAALVGVVSSLLLKEFRIKRGLQRGPVAF